MSKIDTILDFYTDDEFLILDNFDEAILGMEESRMVLIYSVSKCLEILMEDMSYDDAREYFEFNVRGAYMGEKTPIFCDDEALMDE